MYPEPQCTVLYRVDLQQSPAFTLYQSATMSVQTTPIRIDDNEPLSPEDINVAITLTLSKTCVQPCSIDLANK